MAEAATAPSPFPLSMAAFMRLTGQQKLVGMIVVSLFIAFLIGSFLWAREPAYAVLFSIQDEKDGGQIVAALQQQNIPYRFSDGGHTILVPQNTVHDTRLRLAAQGLPKGGLVGFELLENQKMGVSQFAEQINYQRGLEGELARSVQSLAAVKGARVHLAIPKQTAFLRDEQKTSASVLVSLHPGRMLEPVQVAGIINLVASSVPQLNASNVAVIDQEGRLLSPSQDSLRNAGLEPAQIKYVRDLEASYAKRIEDILSPIVGANNVHAQITADIDFSQVDQVAETYKPNPIPETAIRSQQVTENNSGSPSAAGIPGALSNQPPVPATAPLTQPAIAGTNNNNAGNSAQNYSKNTATNYEVDKTIRHTKGSPGSVRRLSVAVVVNYKKIVAKDPRQSKSLPLTTAEIAQLTELSRDAIGFNKERGDTLSVANAPFTPIEPVVIPDTPLWANTDLQSTLKEVAKYLLFAGLAFFFWTRLVKPVMKTLTEAANAPNPDTEQTNPDTPGTEPQVSQQPYETKLAMARDLVKKDPKIVAGIVKEWVDGGERAK
ncbi:MAG: flagellar basal-body MS-ring/collar protein FliF [Rugosibacter sp.]|nr:flagellar basal-body MS-ring/collar protein FliF [Rugosibacter sp.]